MPEVSLAKAAFHGPLPSRRRPGLRKYSTSVVAAEGRTKSGCRRRPLRRWARWSRRTIRHGGPGEPDPCVSGCWGRGWRLRPSAGLGSSVSGATSPGRSTGDVGQHDKVPEVWEESWELSSLGRGHHTRPETRGSQRSILLLRGYGRDRLDADLFHVRWLNLGHDTPQIGGCRWGRVTDEIHILPNNRPGRDLDDSTLQRLEQRP